MEAKAIAAEKEAFDRVCGACHSTNMINSFRSEPDWRETVDNMIQTGAKGSDEDFDNVMRYLARNWTQIDINSASAGEIAAALGVKAELGAAVVKYRANHEPFETVSDLKKVPGMAQVDVENRKDRIVFSKPAGKENR
jgi:competence ComEA-like helix-hairpin-helix protein